MNDNAVTCRDVRKSYKDTSVLQGLNMEIPRGSVFGLLGKNGAGKTTLLKCLIGLLAISGGEISILGMQPDGLEAQGKSRIGYVPQKIELYPWMKVQALADYTGSFHARWDRALVSRLIAEWELRPGEKVGALSVGQAQKLAIILALGHEPELLILDEPAASLDPAARRQFLKTILDLSADREQTVVFSTHITADIERVADRVGIIESGRTLFSGELGALKDSVKKLHIKASSPIASPPHFEGLLAQEIRGQEALLTVKGCDAAMLSLLKGRFGVDVEVIDLNLEDIFLSLHSQWKKAA